MLRRCAWRYGSKTMIRIIYLLIPLVFLISPQVNAGDDLPIFGEWAGKDSLGNGVKLVILENTLEFYWVTNAHKDIPLPENEKHEDITFFKSTSIDKNNEYIALKPGEDDLIRFVLHPNGELTTHDGGRKSANATLTKAKP